MKRTEQVEKATKLLGRAIQRLARPDLAGKERQNV